MLVNGLFHFALTFIHRIYTFTLSVSEYFAPDPLFWNAPVKQRVSRINNGWFVVFLFDLWDIGRCLSGFFLARGIRKNCTLQAVPGSTCLLLFYDALRYRWCVFFFNKKSHFHFRSLVFIEQFCHSELSAWHPA